MTGFGPFGQHAVNASWVAVQELEKLWKQGDPALKDHALHIREIPVCYSYVKSNLPDIYKTCTPELCVHVGVSPYNMLKLERRGRNAAYIHPDIYGKSPPTYRCEEVGPDFITTRFNLERVCHNFGGTPSLG